MEKPKWHTLKIPKELADEIDAYLQMHEGKKRFHSKTNFIERAISDALEKYHWIPYQIQNHDQNLVRVRDNTIKDTAEIEFKARKLWCRMCESFGCPHIVFCYMQDDIRHELKKRGWPSPI